MRINIDNETTAQLTDAHFVQLAKDVAFLQQHEEFDTFVEYSYEVAPGLGPTFGLTKLDSSGKVVGGGEALLDLCSMCYTMTDESRKEWDLNNNEEK